MVLHHVNGSTKTSMLPVQQVEKERAKQQKAAEKRLADAEAARLAAVGVRCRMSRLSQQLAACQVPGKQLYQAGLRLGSSVMQKLIRAGHTRKASNCGVCVETGAWERVYRNSC